MHRATVRQFFSVVLLAWIASAHAQTTLISTGAVWKYLDNGSDEGSAWRLPAFDDSQWPSGPAQLGYGDGDEATTNSFGPDPANKYITTYYRHAFTLSDPASITNLVLRVLRDDGAVVYLNGTEVYRSNLPTGQVSSATLALRAISGAEEVNFLQAMINRSPLRSGANVVAVEIHQATNDSSDISFDLGLTANIPMLPRLVPLGSVWKYLDTGTDPGPQWRQLAYDDSSWPDGPAQLGYGDGDEITRINSGPSTNVFLAYYFRHVFDVPDPTGFSNLVVRVMRDDGVIVYLNGTEVFRNNMPAGPVDAMTPATTVINTPQESQFYSGRADANLLQSGPNILAVEVHQGNATSSDVSFDLELLPNIPATPPEISITMPVENYRYTAPAEMLISAAATDFDGIVTHVAFLVNGSATGQDNTEPYSLLCSGHPIGTRVLHAIAADDSGLMRTSAPVQVRVVAPAVVVDFVTNGSVWRYFDHNADQEGWHLPGFNDVSWLSGAGQFGYGEGDETTRVTGGQATGVFTHYFRHKFVVSRAAAFTNVIANVLRDDGVVVYLNGQEAFRMNMPLGSIARLTYASSPVGGTNENFYFPTNISANFLVDGTNTLAVELHQTSGSADGSFDMSLMGIGAPGSDAPYLQIERTSGKIILRWDSSDVFLQYAPIPGWEWTTLTNASSPYEIPSPSGSGVFRLRGM